jgi:flagellin-specific chaperone FliS
MRKFSQQQLMQFLYDEASPILKMAIDRALISDSELQKEIKLLRRTQKQLDDLKKKPLAPSKKTIDAIMEYAKQTAPKKSVN